MSETIKKHEDKYLHIRKGFFIEIFMTFLWWYICISTMYVVGDKFSMQEFNWYSAGAFVMLIALSLSMAGLPIYFIHKSDM